MQLLDGLNLVGEFKLETRRNMLYVVGQDILLPVKDESEGEKMIRLLNQRKKTTKFHSVNL